MSATYAEQIIATETLAELAAILNEMRGSFGYTAASREGIDFWTDRGIDLTALPTFGGKEPADPSDIWSWDPEHVLMSGEQGFRIYHRSEVEGV